MVWKGECTTGERTRFSNSRRYKLHKGKERIEPCGIPRVCLKNWLWKCTSREEKFQRIVSITEERVNRSDTINPVTTISLESTKLRKKLEMSVSSGISKQCLYKRNNKQTNRDYSQFPLWSNRNCGKMNHSVVVFQRRINNIQKNILFTKLR